jgi:oligopeptide/dipeptide ABC transporter ATP-binding protein
VERIADRISVMYRGLFVEQAPTDVLIQSPLHPYTKALLAAVPTAGGRGEKQPRIRLRGEPPKATEELRGCPFASRCPLVDQVCRDVTPPLESKAPGHDVACHLVG